MRFFSVAGLGLLIAVWVLSSQLAVARGGGMRGGGGGFSGGGMSRSAGNAGFSRPAASPAINRATAGSLSQSANRSPSLSRTVPHNTTLAATTASRPAVAANRPALGTGEARASNVAARPHSAGTAFQSGQSFQRPTSNQLDDFLNPSGTNRAATTSARSTESGSGFQSKSFTTEGGHTITVVGGRGSGTTEGGVTVGGAAGGVKIETAGGDTYVRGKGAAGASQGDNKAIAAGSRSGIKTAEGASAVGGRGVRAATDGENSAIRTGGGFAAQDAQGNAIAAGRGGYADSSGYRQGGVAVAQRDSSGYARVNVAGGYSQNGTGQTFRGAAVKGPNGNVVATGRGAAYVNGQFVGGTAWSAINGNYTRWNYFGPGYYNNYPGAWWPGKWAIAATAWTAATWAVAGVYSGCSSEPMYYDYGQNVSYEDGTVFYDDQPVASAEQYYDQASQIADTGEQTRDDDWLPLGVFAVVASAEQSSAEKVVQLAINREAAIRGNLQDMLTDQVVPVVGAVDRETQRVALRLEGNDDLLVETGLYNLTNDEVPVLVHFGPDRREERSFIRLKQPESDSSTQEGSPLQP
ncbi:MAG: hypothetical protein KF752_07670 [Pirellulaceae bacterium]|nr:hypothetical protein [Pirellulaceae bacterium]